jgi:hypothetical protein
VTVHSPFEFARSFSTALRPERVDALTANRWTFATKG